VTEVLVDALRLAAELRQPDPPLLLDVRWALGDPHGREHYLAGHLPDAVFVDLEKELAAPAAVPGGRHPLPSAEALTTAARRWGLRAGRPWSSSTTTTVVSPPPGPGGRCAGRAWTTSASSTAR
jgi:thiosulfate/3-mercaptopyruvate sulfurtransferase